LRPGDRLQAAGVTLPSEAVFSKHLKGPAEIVFDSACKAAGGKGRFLPAIWLQDITNLRLISQGMIVSNPDGAGVLLGGATGCVLDGWDVRNCGGVGFGLNGSNATVASNYIRASIREWALDPTLDNHLEKGTGLHGLIIENSHTPYRVDDNTLVLTTPGSKLGGSLLEVGSTSSTRAPSGNKAWLQAADLLQDAQIQTAANALNLWGHIGTLDVLWIGASGLHGHAVSAASGSYKDVRIESGEAVNCCLNPRYKGQSPWMKHAGLSYAPGPFTPAP
jgi:hypothetical protein